MTSDHETVAADVVVVGAGMAGLAAAVSAAEAGAHVVVLDKASEPGGTVPIMGGFLWTARDLPTFLGRMTHADPPLARLAVEQFEPSIEWLGGLGVDLGPRNDHFFEWGVGYPMARGPMQYIEVMTDRLRRAGTKILTGTPAVEFESGDDGSIVAVHARDRFAQRSLRIECRAVVVATGGFQANPEMLTRYLGRWGDRLFLRATPWGTGDGIELARAVGARPSRGYHAFYGQLMPAPPAVVPPAEFRAVTQYNSIHMIVVNRDGRRFVDESIYDSITCQALAHEEEAVGFLLTDGSIDEHDRDFPATPTASTPPTDRFRRIQELGGTVVTADDEDGLVEQLGRLGVYRPELRRTLAEFNEAARQGTADQLRVRKRRHAHPIERPPFRAIPVVPGISFTHGGLAVSDQTEVLDWYGSPVPGLFAAGADAGGLFYEQYLGGAATSLVFGRTAGASAARVAGTS